MSRGGAGNFWESLVKAMRSFWERLFGFTSGSAWFRFIMIPLIALLLWAISMPISAALNRLVEFLVNVAPGKLERLAEAVKILIYGLPPSSFPTTPLPATPPPPADFLIRAWNWVTEIGTDRIQLIILVAASLWIAYRLMIHFVFFLYEIDDFSQAKRMVESAIFPFMRRKAVFQNGVELTNGEISVQEMVGGRTAFFMDATKGFAAVMERPGSFTRVVGPQDRYPVSLDGFTHLRDVVDLRDQRLTISVSGYTKDGIPVKAHAWSFNCRVAGSELSSYQKHFVSCEPVKVHNLVYCHWIGQDWKNRSKRHIALNDLVSTVLRDFMAGRCLVEFLPELAQVNPMESAQPSLIDQFIDYFAACNGEHGLQLVWTGRGEWQLAPEVDLETIRQNSSQAYDNWRKNHPQMLSGDISQKRREEAQRLVHHVVRLYDDLLQAKQPEDQVLQALARHYLERLQAAIRLLEARGEKPSQEWLEILRHLENLV